MLTRAHHAVLTCFRPERAWLIRPLMALVGLRARRQDRRGCPRFTVRPGYPRLEFGSRRAAVLLWLARRLRARVSVRTP